MQYKSPWGAFLLLSFLVWSCGDTVVVNGSKQTKGSCTPQCSGRQCGSDGCGGICGSCGLGEYCLNFKCNVGESPIDLLEQLSDPDFESAPDNSGFIGDDTATATPNDNSSPEEDSSGTVAPTNKCFNTFDDNDSDGFGNLQTKTELCGTDDIPSGKAVKYGDCNDSDANISPGAIEICDNIDNDCDGEVDDGCDADGDGYCTDKLAMIGTPSVCPHAELDCNDSSNQAFPGNLELPGDALDNDCDGTIDEVTQCPGVCTGQTTEAFLCAMEICSGAYSGGTFSSPTGDSYSSAWTAVSHFGNASNDLAPLGGNSYALLASGPASGTSHTTDLSGGGSMTDNVSGSGDEMFDAIEFVVTLTAPSIAQGFSIDYVFMSEEYEEFIGTSFNDKFFMLLKAPQTTGNSWKIINYTDCRSPSTYYDFIDPSTQEKQCYLAINTALSEPCTNPTTDISGTGFECGSADSYHGSSTGWLYTSWPIKAGETFQLKFHIHDTADGIYDSLVILDNFHWLTAPFTPGTASHN